MPEINLSRLEAGMRYFLASFLFLLSLAVISGLIYVAQGTVMLPKKQDTFLVNIV